jgi:hypothetical protein
MMTPLTKIVTLLLLTLGLMTAGLLFFPAGEPTRRAPLFAAAPLADAAPRPDTPQPRQAPRRRAVILLWMSGGPSQLDTFDMKPGQPTASPIQEIDTDTKGIRFSAHLRSLSRQASHLALIRSLTHSEGSHARAAYLMRTGYPSDGQTEFPSVGAVLAKELADPQTDLPRYVAISPNLSLKPETSQAGFLGASYSPLIVGTHVPGLPQPQAFPNQKLALPPLEAFQLIDKDKAPVMRKAVLKTFDLREEKEAVRRAYGPTRFGEGCLLARRLVEQGVPVVEVNLGGWDAHAGSAEIAITLSATLDPAWSALLTDLRERKLLDTTLVVWMGEFGRTPTLNAASGRDHWPYGFTVVLAGGGIKGGVVVGKTSADGSQIEERPVTPAELLATIYRASGIDISKAYRSNQKTVVPLVDKGTEPVKELLK